MNVLLAYITAPDRETARTLAQTLVKERLAACANVICGVESFYWWEEKVEQSQECLCLCKTTESRYPALEKRAVELHPYELPCVVALPLAQGLAPFADWVNAEVDEQDTIRDF